jgi:hypothetical protein
VTHNVGKLSVAAVCIALIVVACIPCVLIGTVCDAGTRKAMSLAKRIGQWIVMGI